MSLVELIRCPTRVEAAMIQARLEASGIASFLFDAEMSWALPCRVMVDEAELGLAREAIDEPV